MLGLPLATLVSATGVRAAGNTDDRPGAGHASVAGNGQPAAEESDDDAYQRGFDEGAAAAEAALRQDLAMSVRALGSATQAVEQARHTWTERVPGQAVELALELTEMILMRELETSADPGREAIMRCLGELSLSEAVVVHLNPVDFRQLGATEDLLAGRSIELVANAEIASGDALADFAGGSVDASLSRALERVAEVLRSC